MSLLNYRKMNFWQTYIVRKLIINNIFIMIPVIRSTWKNLVCIAKDYILKDSALTLNCETHLKNLEKCFMTEIILKILSSTLREKWSYSEFFWSVFSRIWTEYEEILRISSYSVRMRENMDQNNSEYKHFLPSAIETCKK